MNVLGKAEKALEFLKNAEGSGKIQELQAAAGTLGRCLGSLGVRSNLSRQYGNLLNSAIPTLLALASHPSAEVRLLGDEALNRAVAGGFAFHSYKLNIILQNQILPTNNPRWFRAALSRTFLSAAWLRCGAGRARAQAQALLPKLSQLLRAHEGAREDDVALLLDTMHAHLPRVLAAIGEYSTDEEIAELLSCVLRYCGWGAGAVRRGAAGAAAVLLKHRTNLLPDVCDMIYERLWPAATERPVVGWFLLATSVLQQLHIEEMEENQHFTLQHYLELYQLCIHYISISVDHNTQNCVLECLCTLLNKAAGQFRRALLDKSLECTDLAAHRPPRGRVGAVGGAGGAGVGRPPPPPPPLPLEECDSESGRTASSSVEDLTIHSGESPASASDVDTSSRHSRGTHSRAGGDSPNYSHSPATSSRNSLHHTDDDFQQLLEDKLKTVEGSRPGYKVNIGSSGEAQVPLKYCARLVASRFLLTGNKGGTVPDSVVRVSVKSSALNCLCAVLRLYPQALTLYLDKEADKSHNISGSSLVDSNPDNLHDFILERNVCYQDSLTDSLARSLENHLHCNKPHKSLEKSTESYRSSTKDVSSNILDSKIKSDLINSGITDSTNPNMSISNFTSHSNMTGSNTGYPMSSSADVLSSSIDLDMKFDHFGESLETTETKEITTKRVLKRTEEIQSKDAPDFVEKVVEKVKTEDVIDGTDSDQFVFQHMSELVSLFESHSDPQLRGLVRALVGSYLASALELSAGDYNRWRCVATLPTHVTDEIAVDKLVQVMIKGVLDRSHTCVCLSLAPLRGVLLCLCRTPRSDLVCDILRTLSSELADYYLVKVNLCKLYAQLDYDRLSLLLCGEGGCEGGGGGGYLSVCSVVSRRVHSMLGDQDGKVRAAAATTLVQILPKIHMNRSSTQTEMLSKIAAKQTANVSFHLEQRSLDVVKEIYFLHDLPESLKWDGNIDGEGLNIVLTDIMERLMGSNSNNYTLGLLEVLRSIPQLPPRGCSRAPRGDVAPPGEEGAGGVLLRYCVERLYSCSGSVAEQTQLMDICTLLYPAEVCSPSPPWLERVVCRVRACVLRALCCCSRTLNDAHAQRVPPAATAPAAAGNKHEAGAVGRRAPLPLPLPAPAPSPPQRRDPQHAALTAALQATYSNFKVNLEPKSSIFYKFLASTLNALAVLLELSTENEFGPLTEEILYYLKVIMPYCPENAVICVTQLLKCLFGTNMINQYSDFASISTPIQPSTKPTFYEDFLQVDKLPPMLEEDGASATSQKEKNPAMVKERELLTKIENFSKNKSDKKWSTNKKELERYIRMFEPVVIQALKSYTVQQDVSVQRQVLALLGQLLALRVNYCMLDSDQVFIGVVLNQLSLLEQHEIPNGSELVGSILLFLVQLASSRHHTKQIIEVPKLIQICDGLLAGEERALVVPALRPLAATLFAGGGGAGGAGGAGAGAGGAAGAAGARDVNTAREVLYYIIHKCHMDQETLQLISCVLALTLPNAENYYRYSEVSIDAILHALSQRTVELERDGCIQWLERLLDSVSRDVLLDQKRVQAMLKILFQAPPEQSSSSQKEKLRYLSTVVVLLRKYLVLIPESEILLSIDYMKATLISPHSIFFNVKTEIDPLHVQNVNENCASLPADVILVRLLFRTLTYAIIEVDSCQESECANMDLSDGGHKGHRMMYRVCVNLVVIVKHMLHLTSSCHFPVTSKTAQTLLHNEQSILNTGLYSPTENIPLQYLSAACIRRAAVLAAHYSHLLVRLNFLEPQYWESIPHSDQGAEGVAAGDVLQVAGCLAYCEHFVEQGLTEAVPLTWLIMKWPQLLVRFYKERVVHSLIQQLHEKLSSSRLLLQALSARCRGCLKGELGLNTAAIVAETHDAESGAVVYYICRNIGAMEPALAHRFATVALARVRYLSSLSVQEVQSQLTKEDLQLALGTLQRELVHVRFPALLKELSSLASCMFELSPAVALNCRSVSAALARSTNVDVTWRTRQARHRCCRLPIHRPIVEKRRDLAGLIVKLPQHEYTTVITCPEFDRNILAACFTVLGEDYMRDLVTSISKYEGEEYEKKQSILERERARIRDEMSVDNRTVSNTLHVFKKSDSKESKSQFFIPIKNITEKIAHLEISEEKTEMIIPVLPPLYTLTVDAFDSSLTDVTKLFPKHNRPLSHTDNANERTVDRYAKKCSQVFQDQLFYQEYMTLHTILTGFIDALSTITSIIDETDCESLDKCIDELLPTSLAKNIASFCVISLQYVAYLIKHKDDCESPIHADEPFLTNNIGTERVHIDKAIRVTLENVSKALEFIEIWQHLNKDNHNNRTFAAINSLYTILEYLVKDSSPLPPLEVWGPPSPSPSPVPCPPSACDRLLSMLQYWETHGGGHKWFEGVLTAVARLDSINGIAVIPAAAWRACGLTVSEDACGAQLPLAALEDRDVLHGYIYRTSLIGWHSARGFADIWASLASAWRGAGGGDAARAAASLLRGAHAGRGAGGGDGSLCELRAVCVGSPLYRDVFGSVAATSPSSLTTQTHDGLSHAPHYPYLHYISESGLRVRRRRRCTVDSDSCIQLLLDLSEDMLHAQSPTSMSSMSGLAWCLVCACEAAGAAQRPALAQRLHAATRALPPHHCPALILGLAQLQPESPQLDQLIQQCITSRHAPTRQAAMLAAMLRAHSVHDAHAGQAMGNMLKRDTTMLSPYEQALQWWCELSLPSGGGAGRGSSSAEPLAAAVHFVLNNPTHYCTQHIVQGVSGLVRRRALPKEVKKSAVSALLQQHHRYRESHALTLLMVHLFSAETKLLSPKLASDVSNMDPDILMNSMERITLLYKMLKQFHTRTSKDMVCRSIEYFLRESLPPAAILSRAVMEAAAAADATRTAIHDGLRWNVIYTARAVHEVFETGLSQDQLPVLSGWIFETLTHLLSEKVPSNILPYFLTLLLVCASPNENVRQMAPLVFHTLKLGLANKTYENKFKLYLDEENKVSFEDKRLLCVVSLHSNFSDAQLGRLKELCLENECLSDLLKCLTDE